MLSVIVVVDCDNVCVGAIRDFEEGILKYKTVPPTAKIPAIISKKTIGVKPFRFNPIYLIILNESYSAHNAEVQTYFIWGAVVEDVRTVFERRNDATIYIPDLQPVAVA